MRTRLVLICLVFHFLPSVQFGRLQSVDLGGTWSACTVRKEVPPELLEQTLASCEWAPATVPNSASAKPTSKQGETTFYRRQFPFPELCRNRERSCILFIGGLTHHLEVILNGTFLGSHTSVSNVFPARFSFPIQLLREGPDSNDLVLAITPSRSDYALGIARGPVVITTFANASRFTDAMAGQTVVLPLLAAIGMLSFATFAFLFPMTGSTPATGLKSYALYCLISGIYLLGLSRLPREYLPFKFAYNAHFAASYGMDWALFLLACRQFGLYSSGTRVVNALYACVVGTFLLLTFTAGLGLPTVDEIFTQALSPLAPVFDRMKAGTYLLACLASPLMLAGKIYAYLGVSRIKSQIPHQKLLTWTLVLAIALTLSDMLTFFGWIQLNNEHYYARFYPFFIGISFGYLLWSEWNARRQSAEIVSRIATVASRVAHDIRSPIAALRVLERTSRSFPEDERRLLQTALQRIDTISSELLAARSGNLDSLGLNRSTFSQRKPHSIAAIISTILLEQRFLRKANRPCRFIWEVTNENFSLTSALSEVPFKQSLTNLINNAAESVPEAHPATVEIRLTARSNLAEIEIRDNGIGIDDGILARLRARTFGTSMKSTGHGIGLQQAYEAIEVDRGTIHLENLPGGGAMARVTLMRQAPPSWLCTELRISRGANVYTVDDDETIHATWAKRFTPISILSHLKFSEFAEARSKNGSNDYDLYLIDHELSEESLAGLKLIHDHGIAGSTVLVSGAPYDTDFIEEVEKVGVRFLPKDFISAVPIIII